MTRHPYPYRLRLRRRREHRWPYTPDELWLTLLTIWSFVFGVVCLWVAP